MMAVAPDEVPYWINAANAVLVPSQEAVQKLVAARLAFSRP